MTSYLISNLYKRKLFTSTPYRILKSVSPENMTLGIPERRNTLLAPFRVSQCAL